MYEIPQGRGSYRKKALGFLLLLTLVSGFFYVGHYFHNKDTKVNNKGVVNSEHGLLFHESSSNKSKSCLILSAGDTVQILKESDHIQVIANVPHTWYQVQHKNSTGWVLGGFITILE